MKAQEMFDQLKAETVVQLEALRDDLGADLRRAEAERDKARAEAARHLDHLRIAHPAHFTPNVLGQRMCGCGGAWPCQAEGDQAQAALQRVRDLREHYRASDDVVDGDLRAAELDRALDGSGT